MSNEEKRKELDKSIEFFDNFVNEVLKQNVEGVNIMEVVKEYNNLRNALSQLYVD